MDDLITTISRFCRRLDGAGITYVIGGSIAAGIWGEPRQTNDVDVEVWVTNETAEAFLNAFDGNYLVSRDELFDALNSMHAFASVQVLDSSEILKFDCFLQGSSPVAYEMLDRAVSVRLGSFYVRVASAEHIIVQKLRWFDLGNRVSERQWRDLVGIVETAVSLDWELIERWAGSHGVANLVARLRLDSPQP